MISIYAGATRTLHWDGKEFGDDTAAASFVIQQLDFWQAQQILDDSLPPAERIKVGLQLGLVAVDGSADNVARFLERPAARIVRPLFDAIVDFAAGN